MAPIHPVSLELLGEGRKLADKRGVELAGVVLGSDRATNAPWRPASCSNTAPTCVYIVTDPALEHYRNEAYTKAVTDIVNTYKPEILLLGATTLGRDLAGSVATTLLTGLTADCTELAIDEEGSLAATRPTFGGSLLCTILTLNYRPQMATVRPRVFPMPAREPGRTGRIIEHPLDLAEDDIVTKVVRFVADRDSDKVQLAYADIVVAGGLGLRSAENFQLVQESRRSAGRRIWRLAPARPEGLDNSGPADRPDRQDNPAEALYRRRHFRRDPASRGCRGRRH